MKIFNILLIPVFFLVSLTGQCTSFFGINDNIVITSKKMGEAVESPHKYEVDITYPVIEGMSDEVVQASINKQVYEFVLAKKQEFVSEVAGWEYDGPVDTYSSFEISFNAYYYSDGIYSVGLGNYTYYQGAAHPNTQTYALNFNLNDGSPVSLSDLFIKGSDYAKLLSEYCISDLKKQWAKMEIGNDYDKEWLEKGAGPEDVNFEDFNISANGLLITFDEYQVGPYAFGPQEVEVPYSALKSVINKEGLLKKFIK